VKQPVVVKLGSSLVVDERGEPRRELMHARAAEIAAIVASGVPVCVVSSGAIALGFWKMGLERRPRSLPRLQAASALGQAALQRAWEDALGSHGATAGQVLLTAAEIADRRAYVNVRNALGALFAIGAVPVVNENDATATDEITFGDNDALAAQVAVLARARLLVLLTSVEGVLTYAPDDGRSHLILDGKDARSAVFGRPTGAGRGGIASKVAAAEMASAAGIPVVIAAGTGGDVLLPLLGGDRRGTHFEAAATGESAFKLWLRFGKRVSGRIYVDEGARRAICSHGRSLLAVGVVRSEGAFRAGDGVDLCGPDGTPFGRGISSVDAHELAAKAPAVEAVHRDRLVLYRELGA
jgi:glutamate 5-kinase